MEYVLEVKDLEKRYKDFKVLSKLNMKIEKGAIYGLVGRNGAGKTTLIRLITGLQKPNKGDYTLFGISYKDKNISDCRKRMGAIIEKPALLEEGSAKENLIEQYIISGMYPLEDVEELLSLVGLKNVGNKKVKNFSLGMRERLGIAISLCSNPDFLILDEPINGLDPEGIIEIRELILKLNQEKGITVLISSHYLDELSKIATHYGFLDEGQIIKEISAKELEKLKKRKIQIIVSEEIKAIKYLESKNMSYEIENKNTINIYEEINVSILILELAKLNCLVLKVKEMDETLENYYLNLIGVEEND